MSLPATSGDFTTPRITGWWPTYPLQDEGNPDAIIYNFRCMVDTANYAKPALNTTMSNATAAQVISLPVSNANAYFIGDINHADADGGKTTFVRQFATRPSNVASRLDGSRTFPWPARANYYRVSPATADDADDDENLYALNVGASPSEPAPVYVTSNFFVEGVDSTPAVPATFRPTLGGDPVDYVVDGLIASGSANARNGDSYSYNLNLSATSPSASSYAADVSNAVQKVIDVSIQRYRGNIFEMRVYKMAAK